MVGVSGIKVCTLGPTVATGTTLSAKLTTNSSISFVSARIPFLIGTFHCVLKVEAEILAASCQSNVDLS